MLKIGLFSKLSRVSIRMLRYYDEIGLLHPAYIDPESDYRYYREDQLPQIGWITALRDMGIQGARRRDRSVEDRQGQLSRYSAREIQNAPRCYRRKLHVPRPV